MWSSMRWSCTCVSRRHRQLSVDPLGGLGRALSNSMSVLLRTPKQERAPAAAPLPKTLLTYILAGPRQGPDHTNESNTIRPQASWASANRAHTEPRELAHTSHQAGSICGCR
jgi:hypothetical protein